MTKKILQIAFALLILFNVSILSSQERIAVIQDSQVKLLDPSTGDIINSSFISLNSGTPKALLQVEDEIWISYQLSDKIERYDLDGIFLGSIDSGLDNIRGMAIVNNTEVWVCNSGSNNGAPGNAIVRYDLAGNSLGSFLVAPESESPFDIIDNENGEVYISYSASDNIERRDYNGNFLGNIVEPGVVRFIQQIEIEEPGIILAAVFSIISGGNQNGIYRFSEVDGTILDFWNLGNTRGVAKLGNGEILWSSAAGVSRLDPVTGNSELISGGSSHYFGRVMFQCTTPPTPTGASQQTFEPGATLADIVIDPTDVTWFATEADAQNNVNPLPNDTPLVDNQTYYAVNIVDGCLSEPFAVTVTVTLGVGEFTASNFKFYPNPTNDKLTLEHTTAISQIIVTNVLGQQVLEKSPNAENAEIDFSQFAKGVYLVKVITEDYSTTIQIIKK